MSAEIESQEIIQDNIESEEARNMKKILIVMKWMGTEIDQDVSEEEEVFQSGLIANEDGEFLSSLEEIETPGEDSEGFFKMAWKCLKMATQMT